jgi:hypothetical protein
LGQGWDEVLQGSDCLGQGWDEVFQESDSLGQGWDEVFQGSDCLGLEPVRDRGAQKGLAPAGDGRCIRLDTKRGVKETEFGRNPPHRDGMRRADKALANR